MAFQVGDPTPDFYCPTASNPRFAFGSMAGRYIVLSFIGMQWGYALGASDVGTGAIWKQVLATLVAYGAFLFVLTLAVPLRGWWLSRG